MLFTFPKQRRSQGDDGAPTDYTASHSIAEGDRRRQSEPIHRSERDAGLSAVYPRPRDNPFASRPVCVPDTAQTLQAAQEEISPLAAVTVKETEQSDIPSASDARAPRAPRAAGRRAETAQPPSRAEHYAAAGYPPELVEKQREQEEAERSIRGQGHRSHGAQAAVPPRAPMRNYASPVAPRMPAQGYAPSNAPRMPTQGYAPPATPRTPYPSPRREPYTADAIGSQTESVGNRLRTPYPQAEEGEQTSPYTVTREPPRRRRRGEPDAETDAETDVDEPQEDEKPKRQIPYLGIAVFVAALALVSLWIMQITFNSQKTGVLSARVNAIQALAETHPFSYRELIEKEAAANNVNPAFIAGIIFNESSFNPKAESAVGARGLMQMMPDTAEWVHGKMDPDSQYSFDLMFDPDTNVHYACWYIQYLGARFHNDPVLVAAAFHSGQTTVENWLNDSRYSTDGRTLILQNMEDGPTKNYAIRVLNSYAIYQRLYYEGGLAAANAA
jgi:soluble lytic murein transglycosylase